MLRKWLRKETVPTKTRDSTCYFQPTWREKTVYDFLKTESNFEDLRYTSVALFPLVGVATSDIQFHGIHAWLVPCAH